jgi:hypothetical protein
MADALEELILTLNKMAGTAKEMVDITKESGWQPIENAPKDGTRILMFIPYDSGSTMEVVFWSPSRGMWCQGDGGWGSDRYEPHDNFFWMALPAPPH